MVKASDPTVYFTNGYVVHDNFTAISCGYLEEPDATSSLILLFDGTDWAGHMVDNDFIVSLTYCPDSNTLFGLGKFGVIKSVRPNGEFSLENVRGRWTQEPLPLTHTGVLSSIASNHRDVLVCGWAGQMFIYKDQRWSPFTNGIVNPASCDFLDCYIFNDGQAYAVGINGIIYYNDGSRWHQLDSPTNEHLYAITPADDEKVYIAGAKGGLYLGDKIGWNFLGEDSETNFWDIHRFHGSLYIAGREDEMYTYNGSEIRLLNMGLGYTVSTNRLHGNDQVLWSFGADDLLKYDGRVWEYIRCPQNEQ